MSKGQKTGCQDQRCAGIAKKPKYEIEHMDVPKDSNKSGKDTKKTDIIYMNRLLQEKTWMNAARLERFTAELISWAQTPEATKLSLFLKMKGVTYDDVEEWVERWPEFKKTLKFVKEMIGDRREEGALRGAFSERTVLMSMPIYDSEWKEETKRMAQIKEAQQIETSKRPIQIIMQDFSDKPEVEK